MEIRNRILKDARAKLNNRGDYYRQQLITKGKN